MKITGNSRHWNDMFHRMIKLRFLEYTELEATFQDGEVKCYDVSVLFEKYPQMKQLLDRSLFLSGRLMGGSGIVWNDDLDLEAETVYQDGKTLRKDPVPAVYSVGAALCTARTDADMTQKELAALTGIDQSDLSKIERGQANPSVATLERIARALGKELVVVFREASSEKTGD